jgi:hypothetical protein
MHKVIGRIWLPATLFAAPLLALEVVDGRTAFLGRLSGIALVVTSLVWWWIVARNPLAGRRHGAMAGATSASIIVLAMPLGPSLALALHGPGRGWGIMTTFTGAATIAIYLVGSIPVGAALGAFAAAVDGGRHSAGIKKADGPK